MRESKMRATKAFTMFVALGMIAGGLGIMSAARESGPVAMDPGPTIPTGAPGNIQPSDVPHTGVIRTVLWEQFTNSKCGFCPMAESALLPALYEYGYDLVAPVFPHVWWPASNDSIWLYSNVDVVDRYNYYGTFSGVPQSYCDGFDVKSELVDPEINKEYFDKALGDLSRFTITTTGNLTTETITAEVEAHEVIPPNANLSIRFAFWENDIDVIGRFGFKGQYFTTYHWAMWDTLPDSTGEFVFPAGANPGDKAWFNRSFFIDPGQGMIADNVGVTVWIQNDNTWHVEQTALEDFEPDDPLPAHDIAVKGLHVNDNPCYTNMSPENTVIANRTIMVNGTVLNWGATNETNVEVNFIVNGTVEQTQYVPVLNAGHGQRVTFDWTPPIMVGDITVAIEAAPPVGDVNATNNIHEKTVRVERPLDLWLSPESFDLQLWEGQSAIEQMSIGNNGIGDMYYDVDIGEMTEVVGSWDWFDFMFFNLSCGNIYNVVTPTTLVEHKAWLDIPVSTEMYFVVYEGDALTGNYFLIQEDHIAGSGTGLGWYSSGPMNVPLQGGKFYYLGVAYRDNVTLGMDDDPVPLPVSFGTHETSAIGIVSFPPAPSMSNALTGQGAMKQAVVTSDGPVPWLSASHDVGNLAPESSDVVDLTIDAGALAPGPYQSYACVHSLDYEEPVIMVPVSLTVLDVIDSFIPVQEGWNYISTPLVLADTSLPNALLDLDGDTTWTTVKHYDQGIWRSWSSFKPPALNDLATVDESMGVWLYIEAGSLGDGFIRLSGVAPSSTTIDLWAGWTMVGYPATDDSTYDVDDLIAATGATSVEGFNAMAPYHIEVLAGSYVLKKGEAYWINVNSDTTWTVNW